MAMTAHVVYAAVRPPAHPATTVPQGDEAAWCVAPIGYDGLVMTDDLGMKALSGSLDRTGARRRWRRGATSLLHCSGRFEENREVADASPEPAGQTEARRRAQGGPVAPRAHGPNRWTKARRARASWS